MERTYMGMPRETARDLHLYRVRAGFRTHEPENGCEPGDSGTSRVEIQK